MEQKRRIYKSFTNIAETTTRYPLTILLLLVIAVINGIEIHSHINNYDKLLLTLIIGFFTSLVAQGSYESFFEKSSHRGLLYGGSVIISVIYYIMILPLDNMGTVVALRTTVAVLILLVAYIWIPTIKKMVTFNETFLALFKAFFQALFYFGILYIGVMLIIAAINQLIIEVDSKVLIHSANIIFVVFAPVYLLSLIPAYGLSEDKDNNARGRVAVSTTKLLDTLISYVIIPITAVFTLVLLIYVITNVAGKFWTDNLMEPLLVIYSITVIVVYLLASNIENSFTVYFRKIFPKVLVPIVLFQTIASILKIDEAGFTHGRYYAILFGVFATIAGVIFSIVPTRKNGLIAPILIGLSVISILPPIDAFTVSKNNQTNRLKNVLQANDMIEDDEIVPKADVSEEARNTIINSVRYLDSMGYTDNIDLLDSYSKSMNFDKIFGFPQFDFGDKEYKSFYFPRDNNPIPITGYDIIIRSNVIYSEGNKELGSFVKDGVEYRLMVDSSEEDAKVILLNDAEEQLISLALSEIMDQVSVSSSERELTLEEATFAKENDVASIKIVVENIYSNSYMGQVEGQHVEMIGDFLVGVK
ncbi:MAG TPA: DUF4153 domain-containing protein [Clostridiales bacterium]|nr:DUF4153 domain-containing protein [Clostridiales bacterium]